MCIISGEEAEKESDKASSSPRSAGKKTSHRSRKITPKMRKRSLQNSASSRRSSVTVIDVSSDSISRSSQQPDRTDVLSLKELDPSHDPEDNIIFPDAADYQPPFGENNGKRSELCHVNKQLDPFQNEMRQELQKLRDERRQELQELRDERRQELQELRNEIHEALT